MVRRVVQGRVCLLSHMTARVVVEHRFVHPIYKKIIKQKLFFLAHNTHSTLNVGDLVSIQESKPFSKKKTWIVLAVVGTAGSPL